MGKAVAGVSGGVGGIEGTGGGDGDGITFRNVWIIVLPDAMERLCPKPVQTAPFQPSP
jgi:hypothetical protein